jgi:hypothetical protein
MNICRRWKDCVHWKQESSNHTLIEYIPKLQIPNVHVLCANESIMCQTMVRHKHKHKNTITNIATDSEKVRYSANNAFHQTSVHTTDLKAISLYTLDAANGIAWQRKNILKNNIFPELPNVC